MPRICASRSQTCRRRRCALPVNPGRFKGEYLIYSGTLNDSQQPTRNERKVSFKVTGQVAKDLFDSMYPDEKHTCTKHTCTSMEGYRERRRAEVFCTYDPQDGYACYFGFDLRNGKSIGGASC